MDIYRLFIDGLWRDGTGGTRVVVNPATELAEASVTLASEADLGRTLAAAVRTRATWAGTPASKRAEILWRAQEILLAKLPRTATRMSRDQGKSLAEAEDELQRARDTLLWSARAAERLCEPVDIDTRRTVHYQPVGIVAAFTPWNYPAVLTARKLAPALAAGCPVILKAAEEAPAAAVALVESLHEAGLPPGVLGLVFGDPPSVSSYLLGSPEIRLLTFTGSTRVGKELATRAGAHLQKCVLELGGHSPVLVFEDAEIASTVAAICDYKFEYAGQSCNAPSRIYVQRSRYDEFLQTLVQVSASLSLGPMINAQGPARMARLVNDAVAKGATLALGGKAPIGPGHYWPATVLTDVPASARILTEEPFGPVLTVAPFDTVSEAVDLANGTAYGLASYVFIASVHTQRRIVPRLKSGTVSINFLKGIAPDAPLNGQGESGYGHEGGEQGFRAFQDLKLVNRAHA